MKQGTMAWGAGLMAVGVALGAFGAHGLKALLDATALAQWHTGVQYHFMHALGLLLLAALQAQLPARAVSHIRLLFLVGILLFSGSLYLLSTKAIMATEGLTPILGPITPIGGLCFIIGWVYLLITTVGKPDRG